MKDSQRQFVYEKVYEKQFLVVLFMTLSNISLTVTVCCDQNQSYIHTSEELIMSAS